MAKIPNHIAIIMDGNRRWAKDKGLPIVVGHARGYERIEEIVIYAKKIGIEYLTFWAFSTENWKRDVKEVEDLMGIFRRLLRKRSMQKIMEEGARLAILGDMSRFPEDIQQNVAELVEETKNNSAITINIALNYGGRAEIIRAINQLLPQKKQSVTEEEFTNYLYTKNQPDPDLIIRTGGEQRLSGYLPWQSVYSELVFVDTYWPDFTPETFDYILSDYASRERRFGK